MARTLSAVTLVNSMVDEESLCLGVVLDGPFGLLTQVMQTLSSDG